MRKTLTVLTMAALMFVPAHKCFSKGMTTQYQKRMAWWAKARFGMFIHWGIYSVPAKGEWYMSDGHVPRAKYEEYAKQFDPVDFNADRWVKLAHEAGMKYLVITSKHHDGFCMFRTKATKYNVVDDTPWGKDPLKALSAACKKYDVRFCVYYSIMDWHSPDQAAYDPNPEHPTYNPTHFKAGKKKAYIRYMKTQLKELITQYHPGVIWFDGGWMQGWTKKDGREIYDYLRKLDPQIIVNNRAGVGDYETPEQHIPPNGIPGHYWETCMTINNDWGYNASDHDFKSPETLIRNLVDIASKGGNYLLNVGPTDEGIIPKPEVDRLEAMGRWLRINGSAIYGTQASPFTTQLPWGRCTSKKNKLFLEVFNWPKNGKLKVEGLASQPERAVLLDGRRPLVVRGEGAAMVINVPKNAPDSACSVIELDFKGAPVTYNPPEINSKSDIFINSLAVNLAAGGQKGLIRYTKDGTTPTAGSPEAHGPVLLKRTTVLSAVLFKGDRAVSGMARKTFAQVAPIPATEVSGLGNGVRYKYFIGSWDSIPDFAELSPKRTGMIAGFSLPPQRAKTNFGVQYDGYVRIPETGVYTLYTVSDDGSELYLDDSMIVNNNYPHGATEKEGVVALERGLHRIRVDYFQATGDDSLTVFVKGPSIRKRVIPRSWLFTAR